VKTLTKVLESPLEQIVSAAVDCLVIGSGTAGVTTAVALAERGLRVAIVEAGPFLLTGPRASLCLGWQRSPINPPCYGVGAGSEGSAHRSLGR